MEPNFIYEEDMNSVSRKYKVFKDKNQARALSLINELNLRLANIQFLRQSVEQLLDLIIQDKTLLLILEESIIILRTKFSVFGYYIQEFKDFLLQHQLLLVSEQCDDTVLYSLHDVNCIVKESTIITDIIYDANIERNMLTAEGNVQEQIKVFKLVLEDISVFQQLLQGLLHHLEYHPLSLYKIINTNRKINIGDNGKIFNLNDHTRLSYMVYFFVRHAQEFRAFLSDQVRKPSSHPYTS